MPTNWADVWSVRSKRVVPHEKIGDHRIHYEVVCDLLDAGSEILTHRNRHLGNTFLDHDQVGLLDIPGPQRRSTR